MDIKFANIKQLKSIEPKKKEKVLIKKKNTFEEDQFSKIIMEYASDAHT